MQRELGTWFDGAAALGRIPGSATEFPTQARSSGEGGIRGYLVATVATSEPAIPFDSRCSWRLWATGPAARNPISEAFAVPTNGDKGSPLHDLFPGDPAQLEQVPGYGVETTPAVAPPD
jgi:hypothetical protein